MRAGGRAGVDHGGGGIQVQQGLVAEVLGAPKLGLFDDPLAYPGFGLGENMIFPNYELKLFFPAEHKF